jgi:hypothetical protein
MAGYASGSNAPYELHQRLGGCRDRLYRHGFRNRGARADSDHVDPAEHFSMAIELKVMPISTEKYRSTDISGDYAAMARAFGGHGERITKAEDIVPAIRRGIAKTREGVPVLLEFITSKETEVSRPGT